MNRGILDDIIMYVNSMKQVPLQWMPPYQSVAQPQMQQVYQIPYAPQIQPPYFQYRTYYAQTAFPAYQIFEAPQAFEEPQYEHYSDAIYRLYYMLSGLPTAELEQAFSQLLLVTETLGKQLEQTQSMKPAVELPRAQSSSVDYNGLMQQIYARRMLGKSQKPEANQLQQRSIEFPTSAARERWTDALLGIQCHKVQKLTLDTSEKFIWLDKNVKKVFWSNQEGQPACGSFSLSNIYYILVGQISADFVKGRLSFRDLRPNGNSGYMPYVPQLSFVNDKRDVNVTLASIYQCDIWAAAARELEPSISVIF